VTNKTNQTNKTNKTAFAFSRMPSYHTYLYINGPENGLTCYNSDNKETTFQLLQTFQKFKVLFRRS
jgi:hypothetical protein